MSKSTIDGFGLTDFDLTPPERDPSVDENINQTLSRLMGWDRVRHLWRGLSTDQDGRLIISMSGIQTNNARQGATVNVPGAYRVIPANPDRRLLLLFNNVGATGYLGFDASVTALTGFPFAAGAIMRDDIYTGEWWIIAPGGAGTIPWMEF